MVKTGLKYTDLSDLGLVQLALEGDQTAYDNLYRRYKNGVKAHVIKYISLPSEVEDVVSVTFQKAFSNLAAYDPTYKFSTWIFRIARNTAFDYNEKTKATREKVSPMAGAQVDYQIEDVSPEESVILKEDMQRCIECIECLKEDYRQVATLYFVNHYAYQEIADELALPLNTVKTRIRRAKDQLAKLINAVEE